MKSCRSCRWLDVKPDKLGRRRPRRDQVYDCKYQFPALPPMPESVNYAPHWPPATSGVEPEDGTNCPTWEAIIE